jgi:alpha-galactosidase
VYAADRSEALVSYARLRTGTSLAPPPLRLPGLDPERRYRVEVVDLPRAGRVPARHQPSWVAEGIEVTGRQLGVHGLQMPVLNPESAVLVHLVSSDAVSSDAVSSDAVSTEAISREAAPSLR